jgi:hypothetical protein
MSFVKKGPQLGALTEHGLQLVRRGKKGIYLWIRNIVLSVGFQRSGNFIDQLIDIGQRRGNRLVQLFPVAGNQAYFRFRTLHHAFYRISESRTRLPPGGQCNRERAQFGQQVHGQRASPDRRK